MKLGDSLPSFEGATEWIGGEPAPPAGTILLVHFWSTGCPLCHEGARELLPGLAHLRADLYPVAVYQRREGVPLDRRAIEADARELMRIDYPCAIDGRDVLARRFANEFAPGYFVFDRARVLRHRQMGNAGLDRLEALMRRLAAQA